MREFPEALFRLVGLPVPSGKLEPSDVAVNLPELRADHVFVVTEPGKRRRAVYFEYQLHPDRRLLSEWFCKCAALSRQLRCEVLLVVLYLEQERSRTFPDRYVVSSGEIRNEFHFHAVRLWEHGARIRSGELASLAPLLPLCETHPNEETLVAQRSLIRQQAASDVEKADMLALSFLIGRRRFARDVLERIFAEELEMAQDLGIIGDWIDAAHAKGRAETAREFALRLLHERYPSLPESVISRVKSEGVEWCEELGVRIVRGEALTDLGL